MLIKGNYESRWNTNLCLFLPFFCTSLLNIAVIHILSVFQWDIWWLSVIWDKFHKGSWALYLRTFPTQKMYNSETTTLTIQINLKIWQKKIFSSCRHVFMSHLTEVSNLFRYFLCQYFPVHPFIFKFVRKCVQFCCVQIFSSLIKDDV